MFIVPGATAEERIKNFTQSLSEESDRLKGVSDLEYRAWLAENLQYFASFMTSLHQNQQQKILILPTMFRRRYVNLYGVG